MQKPMLFLMLGAAAAGCAEPGSVTPTDATTATAPDAVDGTTLVKFTCPTMV